MAISNDHAAMPAHAHLNLLGFVALFLFGVFYHLHPAIDRSKAANIVLHDFELLEDGDLDPNTALPRTTAMLWHHPRELKREQLVALARGGKRRFGLLRDLAVAHSN